MRAAVALAALGTLTLAAAPVSSAAFTLKIPDVPVTDQHGRTLNFYSDLVKGRTVAINFMFTTCTTICPQLTMAMRRIQQQLGDRVGRDVWLRVRQRRSDDRRPGAAAALRREVRRRTGVDVRDRPQDRHRSTACRARQRRRQGRRSRDHYFDRE